MPPGWTAGVWFDFSDDFTYDPMAFSEGDEVYSNAPIGLIVLEGGFEEGLAVLTNNTVIELQGAQGTYTERVFLDAVEPGPDSMRAGVVCSGSASVGEGLCIAASSLDNGDGLFVISTGWTMVNLLTTNNVTGLGADLDGLFDRTTIPHVYYVGANTVLRYPTEVVANGPLRGPFDVDTNRILGVRRGEGTQTLTSVAANSHTVSELLTLPNLDEPINLAFGGAVAVVVDPPNAFGAWGHAILESQRLVEVEPSGNTTMLAQSADGQDWRWVTAVVPQPAHTLSADGDRFYVLESNRVAGRDRVIWLQPS